MKKDFIYIPLAKIISIHDRIIEESPIPTDTIGILKPDELELAYETPIRVVYGFEAYKDSISKVAALMYELIALHPFIEGNKRTGFLCADIIIGLNYGRIVASETERGKISLAIAALRADREDLERWLRFHCRRKRPKENKIYRHNRMGILLAREYY